MLRKLWLAGATGFACLASTNPLSAQTLGRPVVEVGPSLVPPTAEPEAPAKVTPTVTSTPVGKPSIASPPTPQVKPVSKPALPALLPAPVVKPVAPTPPVYASNFADTPSVVIPPKPEVGPTPMQIPGKNPPIVPPAIPMPGPQIGPIPLPTPTEVVTDGAAKDKADDFTPKLKFKPGDQNLLQVETANGQMKLYAGGRLQIDGVWLRTNDNVQAAKDKGGIGNVRDAVNFRRARFDFGGTFYKNIDFYVQWDFINTVNVDPRFDTLPVNTPAPTDLWATFKELPFVGNFRVGNQKPPISFEHLTSSRFLNFMERSLGFDAFIENQDNGFEPGAMIFDTALDQRATWALGVFKNSRSIFGWNVGDGEYDVTGRLTALPLWENDGEMLVHVGVGASHRDLDDHVDRVRARLELRNGPAILHNIVAESITAGSGRDTVNPELVVVWGPLTLQTEYTRVWEYDATLPVSGNPKKNYGTVQYQAAYAELLYFLTGEHSTYNRKTACFTRVTPKENFTGFGMNPDGCEECGGGLGAWQLGVRYSWIDLDNKGIAGSTCHDITVGLNWFLNPYMKWQLNFSSLYRNAPNPANDGWVRGAGVRLAFDF